MDSATRCLARPKRPKRALRRGATMVEFAFAWTVFFLVTVVGVMDLGRGVWAYNLLAHAAHAGVRHAITRGSQSSMPATADDIAAYVQRQTFMARDVIVSTTWEPDNSPGSRVQVRVQHDFRPLLRPFLPQTIRLTATSKMVIAN